MLSSFLELFVLHDLFLCRHGLLEYDKSLVYQAFVAEALLVISPLLPAGNSFVCLFWWIYLCRGLHVNLNVLKVEPCAGYADTFAVEFSFLFHDVAKGEASTLTRNDSLCQVLSDMGRCHNLLEMALQIHVLAQLGELLSQSG